MKLPKEEAHSVVWGDTDEWKEISRDIFDTSRWENHYEGIFKHKPSGKHYTVSWSEGATECQETELFAYAGDEVEFIEVHQVEKTVKVWEPVGG